MLTKLKLKCGVQAVVAAHPQQILGKAPVVVVAEVVVVAPAEAGAKVSAAEAAAADGAGGVAAVMKCRNNRDGDQLFIII